LPGLRRVKLYVCVTQQQASSCASPILCSCGTPSAIPSWARPSRR